MTPTNNDLTRRAMMMSTAFGALAVISGPARAAPSGTDQERAAIQLVSDFLAAWVSRDANRIAAFAADDIVFKGTPNDAEVKGKPAFTDTTARFLGLELANKLTFAERPDRIYAMGGAAGTVVLALRTDVFTNSGKHVQVPLVGAFWVVGNKLKAWYDFPLVNNLGPGEGESW